MLTFYANYLKKIKINLATGELRGITSLSEQEIKFPIFTKDTGILGTGNIPLMKGEAELVYEFERAINIRTPFAIRRGIWKVPVTEQLVGSETALKSLITKYRLPAEITTVGVSSLPSSQSLNKAIYSLISYPRKTPSRIYKFSSSRVSDLSSILSKISRVSETSRISEVSRISRLSRVSEISSTSRISEIMSRISRISETSKISKHSRIYSPFKEEFLKEKIKRKFKRTPEINALFPDFTARALGLAPKEVSIKQALREMAKIQTGFGIRRGARIKGFTNIQEKQLLAGVMK